MRVLSLIALGLAAVASPAFAADDCQPLNWMDVSAEDASIMASVRPQRATAKPTLLAKTEGRITLNSAQDYLGRVNEEDLSQIRSVQPEGDKLVLCLRSDTRRN